MSKDLVRTPPSFGAGAADSVPARSDQLTLLRHPPLCSCCCCCCCFCCSLCCCRSATAALRLSRDTLAEVTSPVQYTSLLPPTL